MIKEEVILHRLNIQKLGEQKYFQIELPKDTDHIIGIETGVFRYTSGSFAFFGGSLINDPGGDPIDPSFKVSYNDPVGRLTLQTTEGIIYQEEVKKEDKNCKWADFTQTLNEGFFDQYSHGRRRFEDSIMIKTCLPMIEGYYKDTWGVHYSYHVEYDLLIYIWIEKNFSK